MNITFGALPPKTRYISKRLIIGARQGLSGLQKLQNEESVSQIIDLRSSNDLKKLNEKICCKVLGLNYKNYPIELMNRKPLNTKIFESILEAIQNNNGKTFVHCNSGRHRSLFVAAMEAFRNGNIQNFEDFKKFLANRDFYKLRKKSRLGIKFNLTDEDIKIRTANLDFQKDKFWEYLSLQQTNSSKLCK